MENEVENYIASDINNAIGHGMYLILSNISDVKSKTYNGNAFKTS